MQANSLDTTNLQRLLVTRGLLEHAMALGDSPAPNAMAAVVVFDLAVETAGKTAGSAFPPNSHPGSGYFMRPSELKQASRDPSVPRVLSDLLASWREKQNDAQAVVLELGEAARLHLLRNAVQHDAQIPSAEDVERSKIRAVDAARWIVSSFFGVELEEVSRAVLIHSPAVRGLVDLAEAEARNGDYREAMGTLRQALTDARAEFRGSPFGISREPFLRTSVERALGYEYGRSPRAGAISKFAEVIEKMGDAIARLEDRFEVLSMGGEASEYTWFLKTAPGVHVVSHEPKRWAVAEWEPPRTQEQYVRALDFVVSAVLRWQELPAETEESEPEHQDSQAEGPGP